MAAADKMLRALLRSVVRCSVSAGSQAVWYGLCTLCLIFTGCKKPRGILLLERGLIALLGKFNTNKILKLSKSF